MEEKKRNVSFLFDLCMKRKNREEPEEKPEKEEEPAPQAEAVSQEIRELPSQKKYLLPLFRWYASFFEEEGVGPRNAPDYEDYLMAPVADRPEAPLIENTFARKLSGEAEKALSAQKAEEEARQKRFEEAQRAREAEKEAQAAAGHAAPECEEPLEKEPPAPVDAAVYLHMSANKMAAYLFVTPPLHGGAPLERKMLEERLAKEKITYGIKEELLDELLQGNGWMQIYQIAEGLPAVKGKDGRIVPLVDAAATKALPQDDAATIDFKNLNIIPNVEKGTAICMLLPPEKGEPGKNVLGQTLATTDGRAVPPPIGEHVVLSEDGMQLLADIDGQLIERGGRYYVTPLFEVSGDVDYSVGNIDFLGDVIVRGDVRDGFTVKAGGNLTVCGVVEDAVLWAGGDVILKKGMNGGENGSIHAGGNVHSKFLENCTVYAEGDVYATSVVSGKLSCGGSVVATEKPGVLIGGTITARYHVEAMTIGSVSHRPMSITLGVHPREKEIRAQVEARSKEIRETLQMLEKNIAYLMKMGDQLPESKRPILKTLEEQRDIYLKENEKIQEEMADIPTKLEDYKNCWVRAAVIHSPTKVFIGGEAYSVTTALNATRLYLSSSGIMEGLV